MFYDIHCHFDQLEDKDKIAKQCEKENIVFFTNGTTPEKNMAALELASKYKNARACLGMYPIEALKLSNKEIDDELKFIEKNKDKIVGLGEIGIDYKESEKEEEHKKQKEVFEKLVKLSIKMDKPIFVHSRKAELECIEILERLNAKRVLMHCFSGKMSLVERIAKNGWMLSIPANVVFAEHFQQVIKRVPIENLVCETDSPYLHPRREWPNTPLNVMESYKKIAEIKEISIKDVEKKIENNVKRLTT